MHKLGIIVPYRDRYEHLQTFKKSIKKYFEKLNIKYELIIVEQDDAKLFNRGKLLNIGFLHAKKLNCDYVVFHDVDMVPVDVDYSYSEYPVHLASKFISRDHSANRIVFDEYFGGVTIFPVEQFEKINGYSNEYWGWGFEDDDLLYRCRKYKIPLDYKEIILNGGNNASLKFNGVNSIVRAKNVIDFKKNFTIFVSLKPDELHCNVDKYNDIFSIFSIPGYDFRIVYNSFRRYSLSIFDKNQNGYFVDSEISDTYKTNLCITVDVVKRVVKLYQDGVEIGIINYIDSLYPYQYESNFYLGCANPLVKNEEDKSYFKGEIANFAIFEEILLNQEIREISKNQFFGLTSNFGNYKSSHLLKTYYDAKFIKENKMIDLSGNNNDGVFENCKLSGYVSDYKKVIHIPFRKDCTFELLSHEENGYVGNAWKNITTRYNQMRFHNEVKNDLTNPLQDGLSNCRYREHSNVKVLNETNITVGI
jgi:hypothetical protein